MDRDLNHSVVLITSSEPGIRQFGTGFVIYHTEQSTFLLTCAHVIKDVGGPDKVKVGKELAKMIAWGTDTGPDLAVLQTERRLDIPPLELGVSGKKGDLFISAGFQLFDKRYLIKQIQGTLGEHAGLESGNEWARINVWELKLYEDARLQPGYSGAPVFDKKVGYVVGVVSHREGEGKKGLSISVEEIKTIWPDMPHRIQMRSPKTRTNISSLRLLQNQIPIFVGRQKELELLLSKVEAIQRGESVCGFIVGEAGMGKTTLVTEFTNQVLAKYPDFIFCVGQVNMLLGRGTSYEPFKSIMEQLLLCKNKKIIDDDELFPIDVIAETMCSFGIRNLGLFGSFSGVATEALQKRLLEGISDDNSHLNMTISFDQGMIFDCYSKILCNLSNYFPILLFIDDLQWADESSLLLLLHLGRVIEHYPIMLIGTYRFEEAQSNKLLLDVGDKLGSLGAFFIDLQTNKEKLDLFNSRQYQFCKDYIIAKYGRVLSENLLKLLATLTSGNPLFLSETLINLQEKGYIIHKNNQWILDHSIEELKQLPPRIEHVIRERVNRLEEGLRIMLEYASVEGESFTVQVISRIEKLDEHVLLHTIIDKLMRLHQLVNEVGTKRLPAGLRLHIFRFNHVLIQKYIYDYLLTPVEREMIHEEVARCLEELWADSSFEIAPQLATHFSLANIPERTVKYALIAADIFAKQDGWSEVTRFARMGMRAWEMISQNTNNLVPSVGIQLRLLYAKGEFEGGLYGEDIDHTQVGIDVLETCLSELESVEPSLAAQVYLTLGKLISAKQMSNEYYGNQYLEKALKIYEQLHDNEGIIETLSPYVLDSNPANQAASAQQLSHRLRCLKLAEVDGNLVILAMCLRDLAIYYINFDSEEREPLAVAEKYAQDSLSIAHKLSNPIVEGDSLLILSWIYHHRGYYGDRLEQLRIQVLELARQYGQTVLEAEALTDLGHYYSFLIDTKDKAAEIMEAAYSFRSRMGRHAVHDSENYGCFLFRLGQFNKSIELLEASLKGQDIYRAVRTRSQIVRILALTGQIEKAKQDLQRIEEHIEVNPRIEVAANSQLMLSYALLGNQQKAFLEIETIKKVIIPSARRGILYTYSDYPTEIAETYRLLGAFNEATYWIEVASQYWEKLSSNTNVEKLVMFWEHKFVHGKVLVEREIYQEAFEILLNVQVALEKSGHHFEAEAYLFLGRIMSQQSKVERALAYLGESISKAQKFGIADIVNKAEAMVKGIENEHAAPK